MRGSAVEAAAFPATFSSETRENWLATVRGRLGWAWQRWLIYVTGGYAAAAVEARVFNPTLALDVSDTKTRNGFTLGAGIEAAIAGNWTAKLEYLYVGLQNASYFDVPPPAINARTGVPISNNIVSRRSQLSVCMADRQQMSGFCKLLAALRAFPGSSTGAGRIALSRRQNGGTRPESCTGNSGPLGEQVAARSASKP